METPWITTRANRCTHAQDSWRLAHGIPHNIWRIAITPPRWSCNRKTMNMRLVMEHIKGHFECVDLYKLWQCPPMWRYIVCAVIAITQTSIFIFWGVLLCERGREKRAMEGDWGREGGREVRGGGRERGWEEAKRRECDEWLFYTQRYQTALECRRSGYTVSNTPNPAIPLKGK